MGFTPAMSARAASRCALKASAAGAAAFAGTFLFLAVFVLALEGPERLQQPAYFGIAGPSLASIMVRPGVVIAGMAALFTVAAMVINAVIELRDEGRSGAAPFVVVDGPPDYHGLRDWPNVHIGQRPAGKHAARRHTRTPGETTTAERESDV